jgi:serine/threonine protein kinase
VVLFIKRNKVVQPGFTSKSCRQGLVHERKHVSVWDVYEVVKEIGHGMTGKVYQVRQKTTGEVYALKCKRCLCTLNRHARRISTVLAGMEMRRIDPELLDDLRNEIELLKMMDHPNVIKVSFTWF